MNEKLLPPGLPDPLPTEKVVGITTTVPVEVIYAAGRVPVDLNNLFITAADPSELVELAERAGFPTTCCCWTKGIYGAVHRFGIDTVVAVVQGDCSNAHALMEVLSWEGRNCIRFDYPSEPKEHRMQESLEEFAEELGCSLAQASCWRERLARPRELARRIDELSWQEGKVTGRENHLWLVSASDLCSDPERYSSEAERFLEVAAGRDPIPCEVRLGLVGIPPIVDEVYDYLEAHGGLVVYNETQRQFAMTEPRGSLSEQYSVYTYPYGIFARGEDIRREVERRSLDGLIHYVQSFCHRRIENRILKDMVPVPVLAVECDRPGPLSGQLKTSLETFVDIVKENRMAR